jgi:hypothetical protein
MEYRKLERERLLLEVEDSNRKRMALQIKLYEEKEKRRKYEGKTKEQELLLLEKEKRIQYLKTKPKENFQRKILHVEAQNNQNTFAPRNNLNLGKFFYGTNAKFNRFISQNPEQKQFPYYLVDASGNIRCHCVGHPLAVYTEKKQWKCAKPNRIAGKCSLFIPNI